ncbi:MAG: reverse transcriptase-like protein [Coriobacteriia bacterium]|nr:reverse transcriptase-like protein [Coriobacteriia bacterium]
MSKLVLYTDGGSRGNPGQAGIGFSILDEEEREELLFGSSYIGEASNNVAEYRALIWGLENARAYKAQAISVRADSELMIKQINGEYQVKNAGLKPLYTRVMNLLSHFDEVSFTHVIRSLNKRADELANIAMDTQEDSGSFLVENMDETLFAFHAYEDKKVEKKSHVKERMMFQVTIQEDISFYKTPSMHHDWKVNFTVRADEDVDMKLLSTKHLRPILVDILSSYQEKDVTEHPDFKGKKFSLEYLAREIYNKLEADERLASLVLESTSVIMSKGTIITYSRA